MLGSEAQVSWSAKSIYVHGVTDTVLWVRAYDLHINPIIWSDIEKIDLFILNCFDLYTVFY